MNYEAFLLRTHRICSDVHLCETQEWLCWKLPRLGLSVHLSALVCVHPPSAHKWPNIVFDTSLTLPAFINLIELETHKVWKSTSSVAAIAMHCLFSLRILIRRGQSQLWWRLDLELELLLFSRTGYWYMPPSTTRLYLFPMSCHDRFCDGNRRDIFLSQARVGEEGAMRGWEAPL